MANSTALPIMALPFTISAELRFVGHCQHFQLLDIMDQKLLEATEQHVFAFLVARISDVVHRVGPLNLLHTLLSILGFPPELGSAWL